MTKGEFVSSILNEVGLNTKDTNVSRRLVLSIAESYAVTYMAQRLDSLRIGVDTSLVKPLKCFEMEEIDVIKCGYIELDSCDKVMRSKTKIPKTIKGRGGYAIFLVTSIDGKYVFDYTTRYKHNRRSKRKLKRRDKQFFIIEDDYLLLLDSEVEMVDVYMIVLDEEEIEEKSSCSENKGTNESVKCKSLWEEEFVCPEKLLVNVRSATIQEMAGLASVPKDENPNLDSNEKTATVNKM